MPVLILQYKQGVQVPWANAPRSISGPSNAANDFFTYTLAANNSYILVGSYGDDPSGKAFLYDASTETLLHTFDNPDPYVGSGNDEFSRGGVAVSNSYSLIGAQYEDDAFQVSNGKAYLFSNSTGSLLYTFDNPNPQGDQGDLFGFGVALTELYAAIGAGHEDRGSPPTTLDTGKVYIYDTSTGNLIHTIDNPDATAGAASDYFGRYIAMDNNYLVVGAIGTNGPGFSQGAVHIFAVGTWTHLLTIADPNVNTSQTAGDQFGISVSFNSTHLAVGANQEDETGQTNSGKVYIFTIPAGTPVQTIDNPNAHGTAGSDVFGTSLAMNEDYLIVGAPSEDPNGNIDAGTAYIFSTTDWSLVKTLDNPSATAPAGDQFGTTVAINNSRAYVGAYRNDIDGSSSGELYVYDK